MNTNIKRNVAVCALVALVLGACADRKPFFPTGDVSAAGRVPVQTTAEPPEMPGQPGEASTQQGGGDREPIIWRGSGGVVADVQPTVTSVMELPGNRVTLNFVKASLPEVVQAVLGEILGVGYVIDPSVQGEVTVETARPVERTDLVSILETVLQMNGAALVASENFFKVVKLEDAARAGAPLASGLGTGVALPGYGVQIVPLRFVAAEEVQTLLEPLLGSGGVVHADTTRNLVILGGTQSDLQAMLDTIQVFDVDWMAGMSFGIFPVTYAEASKLTEELRGLFGETFGVKIDSVMQIMPVERLNAVMVVTRQQEYLDRAASLITRLDQNWNQSDRRVYVYKVRNSKAADLASILQEIFGASGPSASRTYRDDAVAPGLDTVSLGGRSRAGFGSRGGGTSRESLLRPMVREPVSSSTISATPGSSSSGGASAAPTAAAESGSSGAASETPGAASVVVGPSTLSVTATGLGNEAPTSDIRIIPDEFNNALVIMATPAEFRMVESTLKRLDIEPLQVLIEATIAEVLLNDDLRYGVEWFFREGNHQFNLSTLSGTTLPQLSSSGFSYLYQTANVAAALDLLSDVSDVKVISSPQLMVLGNQTASLQVGDQVPILTRTSTSVVNPDSPTVNEIEYRDTGIILTVTPRVNPGGLVTMEIEQEASSVAETTTGAADSPTIQQRRISSTVAVQSGFSVALGGLIRDDATKSRTGIPVLSDLPIVGALFSRTSDLIGRTELIVILTPRVIGSSEQAVAVTSELRQRMKGLKDSKLWGSEKLERTLEKDAQP